MLVGVEFGSVVGGFGSQGCSASLVVLADVTALSA